MATNLMDVPAEVIAVIDRTRWTVELLFRFFKHRRECRHLLSHRANGIEIQAYLAIIVCMLIALWRGRTPTLRTVELIRFYSIGWAEADELEAHIAKLQGIEDEHAGPTPLPGLWLLTLRRRNGPLTGRCPVAHRRPSPAGSGPWPQSARPSGSNRHAERDCG